MRLCPLHTARPSPDLCAQLAMECKLVMVPWVFFASVSTYLCWLKPLWMSLMLAKVIAGLQAKALDFPVGDAG